MTREARPDIREALPGGAVHQTINGSRVRDGAGWQDVIGLRVTWAQVGIQRGAGCRDNGGKAARGVVCRGFGESSCDVLLVACIPDVYAFYCQLMYDRASLRLQYKAC